MKRVLCLALALFPLAASAQSEEPVTVDGQKVIYQKVTEIEIEGAEVDATVVKPSMVLAMEHKPGQHNSLIKVRADFNDISSWEAQRQR